MSTETLLEPAEQPLSEASDEPVTLEGLVRMFREEGLLDKMFIEVLPRADAPPHTVH